MHTTLATWEASLSSTQNAGGTQPVVLTQATAATSALNHPSQDAFNRLASASLGKDFQAQVLAKQNDGTFLVRISEITARMALPEGGKEGDILSLKLVSAEPRPTFLLNNTTTPTELTLTNQTNQQSDVAQINALLRLPEASIDKTIDYASTPTTLSSTGKLAANIQQAAELVNTNPKLIGKTPISTTLPLSSLVLAQSMHSALELSGLFYESHLAEWFMGNRQLNALKNEPQAKMMLSQSVHTESGKSEKTLSKPSILRLLFAMDANDSAEHQASSSLSTLNEESTNMLSLQLHALEQRQFAWQGQIWPNQEMEWDVSEESAKDKTLEQEAVWRSNLKLNLPMLGTVQVNIRLSGEHVQLQLKTDSDESTHLLQSQTASLAMALDNAGTSLDLLTVMNDDN